MFETQEFQDQLQRAIAEEAGTQRMERYETAIVSFLQGQAQNNERVLMESEMTKAAAIRRGIPDALRSARALVKEAASYATAEGRTLLTQADLQQAYRAKYCQVWPFCK